MNITQEELTYALSYDPETGEFTWKNCTSTKQIVGSIAGYRRIDGYIYIQIYGYQYLAHRLAWLYMYGRFPNQIDHKNRRKGDNRLSNLREVDNSGNMKNKTKYKNNTTGTPGVYWDKQKLKWRAIISIDGKSVTLGCFGDKEMAIRYRKAAELKHGYTPK